VLTAAHGAYLVRRAESSLGALALVMARLRSSDGCPWDREQTHESLQPHLVEETYEVIDAIERNAIETDLAEELGDVLLQVAFHSQLAADDGRFDLADVADHIVAKLVRRHPHVFGETVVADAAEVVRNWETIKREEKAREGAFDDVPRALPALLLASKTQKRAAGLGFSATRPEARARAAEVAAAPDGEPGDLLFWAVAVARAAGLDPETALRQAVARFQEGFA
jgi:MazG family protein